MRFTVVCSLALLALGQPVLAASKALTVSCNGDGSYSISTASISGAVVNASPAVEVDGRWILAKEYPSMRAGHASVTETTGDLDGDLGPSEGCTVRYSGLKDAPDLVLQMRSYTMQPFGKMQLTARNTTGRLVHIEALRLVDAAGGEVIHLGGDPSSDRVLSDSISEDRPAIQIRDLGDAEKAVHRGVGSQLVYNQQSHQSWFIGALTSDKFLSVLRLKMAGNHVAETRAYEVDSTGTTELTKENSLRDSSEADRVELSLPVAVGEALSSERMLFGVSDDYHNQLETYGRLIGKIHRARVSAPTPLGWWSWTAYYFGLDQGTALTNSEWMAEHLKRLGYTFFHIDEGYQYARGEYATPNAALFPDGMAALEQKVSARGLVPGLWTAPFEVSDRSWIFDHHPEWLVRNANGTPIHIGMVSGDKDHLYVLDATHPGAQAYLKQTYSTLVREWGIRYIKMDFMEDSGVEGYYHRPNTTALEAQRMGIKTIREAVGEDVLLDKDGGEMLNPVGLVDMGRISQDTGHTYGASKDAASGIAARYYMNRNYYVADPDAFAVSRQIVADQSWHGGRRQLTLDEAKVSIALSAVSGGMFEIGDDLPTLGEDADRLALVENRDLIDMARLGRASVPLDLMTYRAADLQPSVFGLHENRRQSIITVFNWTESSQNQNLARSTLGLDANGSYVITDILDASDHGRAMGDALIVEQPAHSARMFKIVDEKLSANAPQVKATVPSSGRSAEVLSFSAKAANEDEPVLETTWEFGDGVTVSGPSVRHSYTHSGNYTVHVRSTGVGGVSSEQTFPVAIEGVIVTRFAPDEARRFTYEKP